MSTQGIWQVDWPNANSQRSYPLHTLATKVDTGNTLTLSDDVLVGLYLPIRLDAGVPAEKIYLKTLISYPGGVSITLGYDDGSTYPDVASSTVALASHTEYAPYRLVGVGSLLGSVGRVQFGPVSALRSIPVGQFTFSPAAGKLDADCIRPILKDVSGIVVVNGADRSPVLTGVIEIVAGGNATITWEETETGARIRINAISGDGLTADCDCAGADELGPPIRTINGVVPDVDGNIDLTGDDCIQVTTGQAAIELRDACSKPCCTNETLEKLSTDQSRMGEAQERLNNYVTRLEGSVATTVTTVLGSKLNDNPCP